MQPPPVRPFRWREAARDDLTALNAIADAVHPNFPEDAAVVAERQRLYPAGVRILERHSEACGYLVGHPWRIETVPALNTLLGCLPTAADTFYVHDLALLPSVRGTGAAAAAVAEVAELARTDGFPSISLVAVNGSVPFWRRQGFSVAERPDLAEKLASYEPEARLMIRRL